MIRRFTAALKRRLTDSLTALAALSYPPGREADRRAVRDCAREAIDAGGLRRLPRESLSLLGAGLRLRARVAPADLRQAPWRAALAALTLPLAAAVLVIWVFGFVERYDHWPLGEGWTMLLGGSVLAVVGAALRRGWAISLGALAVFIAAVAPHLGYGTTFTFANTPSFFDGGSNAVDFGASSLLPALLLVAAGLSLQRAPVRKLRDAVARLALGLAPAAVALLVLLPAPEPRPTYGIAYDGPDLPGRVIVGPAYPAPWIWHAETLVNLLGAALLIALVVTWARARRNPSGAIASGLVLVSVAYPVTWLLSRNLAFDLWMYDARAIGLLAVLPLLAALLLMLRGAGLSRA